MIEVQIVAFALLILRLISLVYVSRVLYRQLQLYKLAIEDQLSQFRKTMVIMGVLLFFSNMFPLYIDFLYAFDLDPPNDTLLLIGYATSNSVFTLALSYILWQIYKLASGSLDERRAFAKRMRR